MVGSREGLELAVILMRSVFFWVFHGLSRAGEMTEVPHESPPRKLVSRGPAIGAPMARAATPAFFFFLARRPAPASPLRPSTCHPSSRWPPPERASAAP